MHIIIDRCTTKKVRHCLYICYKAGNVGPWIVRICEWSVNACYRVDWWIYDVLGKCMIFLNVVSLQTDSCHDANFVATGSHGSCLYDNPRCFRCRQSWHHDNSLVSVNSLPKCSRERWYDNWIILCVRWSVSGLYFVQGMDIGLNILWWRNVNIHQSWIAFQFNAE